MASFFAARLLLTIGEQSAMSTTPVPILPFYKTSTARYGQPLCSHLTPPAAGVILRPALRLDVSCRLKLSDLSPQALSVACLASTQCSGRGQPPRMLLLPGPL